MAYDALKAVINAYIKQNGVRAITGQILNGVLIQMVDELGRGYAFMGTATPTGTPASTADPQAYFASTPGTYTNYGGIVVSSGELALLEWNGSVWNKEILYTRITDIVIFKPGEFTWGDVDDAFADGKAVFVNLNGVPLPCVGQDNDDNYIFSVQANDRVFEFTKYVDDQEGGMDDETPFTLNTNNATAQTVQSSEDLRMGVNLHKVSKTGNYFDLLNRPNYKIAVYDYGAQYDHQDLYQHWHDDYAIFCVYNGEVLPLFYFDDDDTQTFTFRGPVMVDGTFDEVTFDLIGDWGHDTVSTGLEKTANKTGDIETNKTSTTKYPNTKGVYDFVTGITGILANLTTTDKTNLVAAINEAAQSGGSPDAVLYIAQVLSDAQKAQARTNIGAGTYSVPAGGIPDTDLSTAVQTSLGLADTAVQPEAGKGLFSGNYNDLTNKPTIPAAQVNSDWDAISGVAEILNKPTIPTVESMTALEVADAVQTAWDAVMV